MDFGNHSVKRLLLVISAMVLLIAGLTACGKEEYQVDERLKSGTYEGVFLTMNRLPDFSEEDFKTYRGLDIVIAGNTLTSFSDIKSTLDIVLGANPEVGTVYLELDPVSLWKEAGEKEKKWNTLVQENLLDVMSSCPGTTFEILLAYPEIAYWEMLEESSLDGYLETYQKMADAVEVLENVLVFYVGAEQWLNSNPENYEDAFKLNASVERNIFLSTLCDRKYLVNSEGISAKLDELKTLILEHGEKAASYPRLEEWSLVFVGDSIIGYDMGSSSIPGAVGALSGATVYNCGKNGATAACMEEGVLSLAEVVQALQGQIPDRVTEPSQRENLEAFLSEATDKEKLCFLINFGLNDYFLGLPLENAEDPYDINTYAGALRTGVRTLQETYPQADFVIMIPTYTTLYQEGTEIMSTQGAVLTEYRETARKVAEELEILCKDNYADLPIDMNNHTQYLLDGCHPNEGCRFLIGEQIIYFLGENL